MEKCRHELLSITIYYQHEFNSDQSPLPHDGIGVDVRILPGKIFVGSYEKIYPVLCRIKKFANTEVELLCKEGLNR